MGLPDNGHGGASIGHDDEGLDGEEQLTLTDAGERLPWLESDDDDYEQPGPDTGRIVAFAAVGLLFVVLLLGGLWWLTSGPSEDVAVADGSTIEAPDTPYKTRPENPGGREVEGTGDTSFEVAEGQTVEGRIASGDVPVPSIDREQSAAPSATPDTAAADGASASAAGIGVQVGAYSTRAQAESGWNQLAGRFEVLKGRSHRVLQGTADSGTVFRLQALAGTVAEAETLCREIKAQGGDCQVKR